MAIVVQCGEEPEVSLDDFMTYATEHVDGQDRDSLLAAAGMLVRLSRNKSFIQSQVLALAADALQSSRPLRGAGRISVIASTDKFVLRLLIWETVPHGIEGSQFFYGIAHDHDFDFLTACCPPGELASEVFSYENGAVHGYAGEPVEIGYQGKITLRPGIAALFRGGRDIHIQLAPPQPCITLNIMGPKYVERSPFWFDVEKGAIVDWVDHTLNAQKLLLGLARQIGDRESIGILRRIANSNDLLRRGALAASRDLEERLMSQQEPNA